MIKKGGRFPGSGAPVTPEVTVDPPSEPSALSFRNIKNTSGPKLFEPPKKDQKIADVLVNDPQKMQALSTALPGSTNDLSPGLKQQTRELIPKFAQVIRDATNYVKEAFP